MFVMVDYWVDCFLDYNCTPTAAAWLPPAQPPAWQPGGRRPRLVTAVS
eukprot:COSAG01_NODE_1247_length_11073_cov_23.273465_14_plen_48_part_00